MALFSFVRFETFPDHWGNLIGYVAAYRLNKLEGDGFHGLEQSISCQNNCQHIRTAKLKTFYGCQFNKMWCFFVLVKTSVIAQTVNFTGVSDLLVIIPGMSQNMKFTVLSFSNQPGLPKGEIYFLAGMSQSVKFKNLAL